MVSPFRHSFDNKGEGGIAGRRHVPVKIKKEGEMVSLASDAAAFLPLISAFEIS
jgi:hypothetical protein